MNCPRCGATDFIPGMTCMHCDSDVQDTEVKDSRDERWERAARRSQSRASDEDDSGQNGASSDTNWKLRLLPILAVIALIAILIGNLLQEAALAKMSDADTLQEVIDASEDARVVARVIQVGIIILALVVAGISIEYRRQ